MKILRRHTLLLLILVLLGSTGFAYAAEKNAASEQQLNTLRERIAQLKTKQAALRAQESSAQAELAKAESALGEAVQSLRITRRELQRARARLGDLDGERRRYQLQRDKAQSALQAQVRAAYLSGRNEYWKLLLSQKDPAQLGRVLTYYDYLNRERVKEMDDLSNAVRSLADVQKKIESEISELNVLQQQQEKSAKKVAQAKTKREKALRLIRSDLADDEKRLNALLQDEKNLTQVIEQVDSVVRSVKLPKNSGFAQLKGKLGWPTRGQLLQRFGDERFQGRMKWNGVLIGASEGSDVQVIFPGRIVFADWLRGFGLMTIVDHGGGYMSLYGHNQSLGKQVGDWVDAGEVIATSGSSGGQGEQGLYFEIRYKGKALDPRGWCKRG